MHLGSKNHYNWQPITFDHLLSGYSLTDFRPWIMFGFWIIAITGSLAATLFLLPQEWISLLGSRTDIIRYFLFNPALIMGVLLFFWFGFEWGFIPVFLSSFIIAFHSQMPWIWALVFGISFVLGLAISAMAYQGFRVPYNLKSLKSVVFFVFISFIASIASSMGAFIWSFSHQLSAFDTLIIWKSWWSGTFLQSILFTGPLLLLGSKHIERAKKKWFTLTERREVSMGWVFGAVSAIAGALALFILSGRYLGKMRVEEVMTSGTFATLADVLGALESFEIITWISIGIIIVTGYGAMTLIRGWNAKLQDEVEKQTHELNQNREALAESLEEKELLLKEIHHRVKNNMAMVGALLELQQRFEATGEEAGLFDTARSRIRSMALAHETLYEHNTLSTIRLDQYLEKISSLALKSFNSGKVPIHLNRRLDDTELPMTKAIPLGLIINELLINAFKHAFSGRERGNIDLNSNCEDGRITLTLADDGVGFTDEEQEKVSRSLGMMLIKKLTKQLRGTLDIDSVKQTGTSISLSFPLD